MVESFAAIGLLQEKLDAMNNNDDNNDNDDNEDNDNDQQELESCSICFGDIENEDLIILDECKHKYHGSMCLLTTIRTDIDIYQKLPICSVCDAEGNSNVIIPNEICKDIIDKAEDEELKEKYVNMVANSGK